jgi:hypothetical protein
MSNATRGADQGCVKGRGTRRSYEVGLGRQKLHERIREQTIVADDGDGDGRQTRGNHEHSSVRNADILCGARAQVKTNLDDLRKNERGQQLPNRNVVAR